MPPETWLAATVNRLISVAVSKPSPNRKPTGNICQLRDTMRNSGRKMTRKQTAAGEEQIELLLGDRLAAPRAAKTPPDIAQNDEIDDGDGEQEERRGGGADDAADRLELRETCSRSM